MIRDLGITEEQFVKSVEDAQKQTEYKKIVDYMLSVEDYMVFKNIMKKRNKELNEQAIK
jgi:hypothetical protein